MPKLILPSFAKGVLAPSLYGRVDTAAYSVGLRQGRNCIVHPYGGVSNRAGSVYIGPVKTHTETARLQDFQFSTTDKYVLVFSDELMRVIRNDGYVTEAEQTITGATQANPVVITIATHGYSDGDQVFIDNVGGMTEINNQHFIVANSTLNTFELTSQFDGTNIDGTGFTAFTSGGTAAKIFELATPYAEADLFELIFEQNADTMTVTHADYDPRDLTRTDHNAWTLTINTYAPDIEDPTGVSVTANTTGAITTRYKVTAISGDNPAEESLAGVNNSSGAITNITQANPAVVTSASHGLSDGDEVEITGVVGMTEVNDRRFTISGSTTNTFELRDEDSTNHTTYTSGGAIRATFAFITNGASPPDNTITWTAVTGAVKYAVYRRDDGIYGLVGETELTTYTEDNATEVTPALTVSPPRARNPFLFSGNFPAANGYYEQRQVYGGSDNDPDTTFYSQTGKRKNMSISIPIQADDAITATLNASQVNRIRHFVAADDLIILTSGSEWRVNSGLDVGFSRDTLRQKPQTQFGASFIKPIKAGTTIIFFEDSNARVQGLDRTQGGSYEATELSELANHYFDGFTAVDAAYASAPEPRIHVVRNDGAALTLTYNKNQEVVAWTDWDTDGEYESVTVLRKGTSSTEDGVYFVVKRTINGNTVRFVERQSSRQFTDVRDAFFVDCGLSLDSPVTITNATAADPVVVTAASHGFSDGDEVDIHDITWVSSFDTSFNETQPDQLNKRRYFVADSATNTFALVNNEDPIAISGATQANPVVITATAHGLSDGDVIGIFDVLGMTELNGSTYTVANSTANTFELSGVDGTAFTAYTSGGNIYAAEDGSAFSAYVKGGTVRKAVLTLASLNYLEGETLVALVDGNVEEDLTVSGGSVTLPRKGSRVHIGKRYIADVELLNIEAPEGTIQGALTLIHHITVRFEKSRGLLIGPNTSRLVEIKQREFEPLGEPTNLLTGDKRIALKGEWNTNGRAFFRQKEPLPMTILAVIPEVEVEDND